jgi:hypothetical protein
MMAPGSRKQQEAVPSPSIWATTLGARRKRRPVPSARSTAVRICLHASVVVPPVQACVPLYVHGVRGSTTESLMTTCGNGNLACRVLLPASASTQVVAVYFWCVNHGCGWSCSRCWTRPGSFAGGRTVGPDQPSRRTNPGPLPLASQGFG